MNRRRFLDMAAAIGSEVPIRLPANSPALPEFETKAWVAADNDSHTIDFNSFIARGSTKAAGHHTVSAVRGGYRQLPRPVVPVHREYNRARGNALERDRNGLAVVCVLAGLWSGAVGTGRSSGPCGHTLYFGGWTITLVYGALRRWSDDMRMRIARESPRR